MDIKVKCMALGCACVCDRLWFTICTAAGHCLYTGRLEQPEKLRPERAGLLCSPNTKNKTHTDPVKSEQKYYDVTKIFHIHRLFENEIWLIIFLEKLLQHVTKVVVGSRNKTTTKKRNGCILQSRIKINYSEP